MYRISEESDGLGVLVTLEARVTGDEIRAVNELLMQDPRFVCWRYQIRDLPRADEVLIAVDDLRRFAQQDADAARISPGQRIALVPRPHSTSALDRVLHNFEKLWAGYASQTLPTLEAARRWAAQP